MSYKFCGYTNIDFSNYFMFSKPWTVNEFLVVYSSQQYVKYSSICEVWNGVSCNADILKNGWKQFLWNFCPVIISFKVLSFVMWVVTLGCLVAGYQCYGGISTSMVRLISDFRGSIFPLTCLYPSTRLKCHILNTHLWGSTCHRSNGALSTKLQNAAIFIVTTMWM
jgi:hypothetical protein